MEMITEVLDVKYTFKEILEIVEHKTDNNLSWRIYTLEAFSKNGLNILELEDEIENSENGISYTFEALKALSIQLQQVIWITLVGHKNAIPTFEQIKNKDSRFMEIIIECIDSSFWELHIVLPSIKL